MTIREELKRISSEHEDLFNALFMAEKAEKEGRRLTFEEALKEYKKRYGRKKKKMHTV
jgi:ElaB/YqjD/DUF883 family membrane-anchored ribosome-binding protein